MKSAFASMLSFWVGVIVAGVYFSHQSEAAKTMPLPKDVVSCLKHGKKKLAAPIERAPTAVPTAVDPSVDQEKLQAIEAPRDRIVDPNSPCFGFSYEKLPPPKFALTMPAKFQTNRMMEAQVGWDGVNGARGYVLFLETPSGKLIRKYPTKTTSVLLKEIPLPIEAREADYVVRVATINGADKMGDKGESRSLRVNRIGSVMAPTLKKIEVED